MRSYFILLALGLVACNASPDQPSKSSNNEVDSTDTTEVVDETSDAVEKVKDSENSEGLVNNSSEVYASEEYVDLDWLEYEKSLTKDFSFVIIISTKNYDAALKRAKEASEKLGYPLDLRGLHPNEEMGLSLPEEVCEAICGGDVVDYPQYLPRNDWGESKYVSIEYSNGFKGFTPEYYIVVVASGEKGDPIIKEALNESRQFYKDAYAKTCGVWMGCGC
jgi:hypothetical protein